MTQCFSAPPAAAIVDRNCFSISLYSAQKPGDLAFIRVASYYPVTMFSQVRTLPRGSSEAQYCELDVVPGDLNRYTLTGCLPQRSEPLPLAFAIQDGASYAGAILKAELTDADITWSGTLLRQTLANDPGTVLASTQSAPLHDLLRIMLKKSDNMIADTVFRTIGHARFNVPGTWRAGSDAVRQILRQQAGVDLGNTIIADGSGLSRHNLIAPATMMQVLQYIAQHDHELNFISMLPLVTMMVLCSTAQACIRRVSMAKSRRKRVHCRGCITWSVSSRRYQRAEDGVRAIPFWLRGASSRPA